MHPDRAPVRVFLFVLLAACGGEPGGAPPPTSEASPACPDAAITLPSERGYATAAQIQRRLGDAIERDVGQGACLVRVTGEHDALLVEASHEGETIRARLAAPSGMPTETLGPHVAAQRLLRTLLEAHVESALSSGRGVGLGLGDHGALCYRAAGADPECVRTPSLVALDTLTEPSVRHLVVRAVDAPDHGVEWELTLGDAAALSTRTGPLAAGRALGDPPPDLDRYVRVRSASAAVAPPTPESAAVAVAAALPTGAGLVRMETRSLGATRVVLLSRCEGLLAHCVSVVATGSGTSLRVAPSFATDPARIEAVEDAAALAAGALRVRIREAGYHEASASDLFVWPAGEGIDVRAVALGSETERGEDEVITEGCYRSLTIEAPGRVRLSAPSGWSGSRSDARGQHVSQSHTCAAEEVRCLDASGGGFGPCG